MTRQGHEIAEITEKGAFYRDEVIPAMEELRKQADAMERLTAEKYWPYPTYSKLLFYV